MGKYYYWVTISAEAHFNCITKLCLLDFPQSEFQAAEEHHLLCSNTSEVAIAWLVDSLYEPTSLVGVMFIFLLNTCMDLLWYRGLCKVSFHLLRLAWNSFSHPTTGGSCVLLWPGEWASNCY